MHFLYQIATSAYIYSLYEEEGEVFLHVLNLRTEESTDVLAINKIMSILYDDAEVSLDDWIIVDDIVTTILTSN